MLAFDRVTRRFGPAKALDAVTFSVAAKTTTAIAGPNGSGKSTLLRLAAALDRPSTGVVRVDGRDLREDARVRARIGFAGHDVSLYDALTAAENVAFRARLLQRPDPDGEAEEKLKLLGVSSAARATRAGALSRGLRQRVSIARALVGEPGLVLLDEPHAGLDDAGADALEAALDHLSSRGAATLVATHDVERLGARLGRVIRLEAGRVVLDGPEVVA